MAGAGALSSGQRNCVVFLGKTLYSIYPGVHMLTEKLLETVKQPDNYIK